MQATHGTGIIIDMARTYTKADLAVMLGVSERSIERQIRGRRPQLPRPFHIGRVPRWTGKALQQWFDRKQEEAMA